MGSIQELRYDGTNWVVVLGGGPPEAASVNPGDFKPTAANIGLAGRGIDKTSLPIYTGPYTITVPGTVIDGYQLNDYIKIQVADVTIKNCWVRGGTSTPTANTALIDCNNGNCVRAVVQDCEFFPQNPNLWIDGIIGHDYTISRCDISGTVDGCGIYNSTKDGSGAYINGPLNVTVASCYIHHLSYWSPDPNHTTDKRSHNDGCQIQGGSIIHIIGNTIDANVSTTAGNGYPGASPAPIGLALFGMGPDNGTTGEMYYPSVTGQGIGVTPVTGPVTQLTIEKNWINYGAQSITFIPGAFSVATTVGEIKNNRFGRAQVLRNTGNGTASKKAIGVNDSMIVTGLVTSTGPDTDGNVYDDDGTPVTVYRLPLGQL